MASDYIKDYYKKGGGGRTSGMGSLSYNKKATVAKNMSGSIANFAKVGDDMYIHTDEVAKIVKGAHGSGLAAGRLAGHFAGAQRGKLAGQAAGMKTGFRAGARAMFGPAAGAALIAEHLIGKGYKRAKENPGFHKGKAGKSYLDLSVNTPGKYGVDY